VAEGEAAMFPGDATFASALVAPLPELSRSARLLASAQSEIMADLQALQAHSAHVFLLLQAQGGGHGGRSWLHNALLMCQNSSLDSHANLFQHWICEVEQRRRLLMDSLAQVDAARRSVGGLHASEWLASFQPGSAAPTGAFGAGAPNSTFSRQPGVGKDQA
jgi:hypothetical protein